MSRKPDPRPARTKAILFEALMQLIQEKRWERIRVQDILDRTGIGRSTFYAHYDNKFDLLTSEIPSVMLPISATDEELDLLPLFQHVADVGSVLLPLMTQPLLGEVNQTFHRELVSSWTEHLVAAGVPEARRGVAAEILAGAFLAVAKQWLVDGCQPEPVAINAEYTGYASDIIARARVG